MLQHTMNTFCSFGYILIGVWNVGIERANRMFQFVFLLQKVEESRCCPDGQRQKEGTNDGTGRIVGTL